jgi:hypothetical protein
MTEAASGEATLMATEPVDTGSALHLSVQRLMSLRHPEGYYEGASDAGVAFDAANIVLARFVGDDWPEDTGRIAGKVRHILSGQDASGLFCLYPRGPCSVEATRIVCLAIDCVLRANGGTLPRDLRDELTRAEERARRAIASSVGPRSELALVFVLRLVLEALDDNPPAPPRRVPGLRLVVLLPVMVLGLLPRSLWRRTDRILYPFIAVFPQLLSMAGWRAVETSRAGAALDQALHRLPAFLRHAKDRAGRAAVRWLLDRQDSTGGFYYSSLFMFLFVPALRNASDMAEAMEQQSPSGGFSFGRGSQYPDVDSTSLATGLFAALLRRNPGAANRAAMLGALTKAFDFLEKHRSAKGGFNAWTIRHGEVPPPMPSVVTSFLFDVSSADVTARVMVTLSRVLDLASADKEAARTLGPARLRRVEDLRRRGLSYLLSNVERASCLWPARWTLGFINGTRFVFDALETYPETEPPLDVLRTAAARTLLACQNPDGGFGESSDSDTKGRFTPAATSAALITAAAWGILHEATGPRAAEAASRALRYILRTQRPDGTWPELSLCTQFPGLYASYELMAQVALTTTLFRVARTQATTSRVDGANGATRRQA